MSEQSTAEIADAIRAPVLEPVSIPAPGAEPKPAPAQPPAAAETPTKEATAEPEKPVEKTDDANDEPKKRSAAGRISELYAQKKAAERQALAAAQEVQQMRAEMAKLREGVDPNDFAAQNRLDIQEAVRTERMRDKYAEAINQDQQAKQLRVQTFETKLDAARERIPDLDQVMPEFFKLPLSDTAADIITESDKAAEMSYFLAKNPQEAIRISQLPAHRQAYELARIEARVTPATPRRTSNAPPPVPTVGASTAPGKPAVGDMSVDEIAREIYGR